ncbi:MAG: D-alanine--D-alanine ligase [Elusimicrobiota bacterium]
MGVLYGGLSAERAISLKSAAAVLAALRRLRLPAAGIEVGPRAAEKILRARVGVAFLAAHGSLGEDGCLQGLLEILGVPYTGSGVLASALAMHKPTAKRLFQSAGLPTPRGFVVRAGEAAPSPSFRRPWVVKPASQGSAIGIGIVRRPSQWKPALRRAFAVEPEVLAERLVPGTEVTVAVLDGRALPVVEIVPRHAFYDYHSKYAKGGSRHIVPARLAASVQAEAARLAVRACEALGCRHFARVDLIVPSAGRPQILEVNTLPGLTAVSLFPDAARAAGMGFDDLILEMLSLALRDACAARGRKAGTAVRGASPRSSAPGL